MVGHSDTSLIRADFDRLAAFSQDGWNQISASPALPGAVAGGEDQETTVVALLVGVEENCGFVIWLGSRICMA
jgi:hypothetical protein